MMQNFNLRNVWVGLEIVNLGPVYTRAVPCGTVPVRYE